MRVCNNFATFRRNWLHCSLVYSKLQNQAGYWERENWKLVSLPNNYFLGWALSQKMLEKFSFWTRCCWYVYLNLVLSVCRTSLRICLVMYAGSKTLCPHTVTICASCSSTGLLPELDSGLDPGLHICLKQPIEMWSLGGFFFIQVNLIL